MDFPDRHVVLRFEDDAAPFDPIQQAPVVEPARSIREVSIGGRGLTLLRKASERLHYERTSDHRNRLTVMIAAQP